MVGRSQSGHGVRRQHRQEAVRQEEVRRSLLPGRVRGRRQADLRRLLRRRPPTTSTTRSRSSTRATGKAKWTQKFPKGWKVEHAYSVDPLVLYLTNEDKNAWNISTLKADGTLRSQVDVDEDVRARVRLGDPRRATCRAARASPPTPNTLYLPTEATDRRQRDRRDRTSPPARRSGASSPRRDESMLPIKVEGGEAHRLRGAVVRRGRPGRVRSRPPAAATSRRSCSRTRQSAAEIESAFYSKAVDYVDGRFYISTTRLTGNDDAKEKLMLAYGK